MTPRADVTVRLATQRDVAGIVDLESRYFVDNLDESARAKGFISVLHSPHWFAAAVDSRGMHVAATTDGHIAGFIAVTDPPSRTSADLPPIVRAMLDIADTIDVNGKRLPRNAGRYAGRSASMRPSAAAASTARSMRPLGTSTATATTSELCSSQRKILDHFTPRPPNSGPDRWRNSRSTPRDITSWCSTSAIPGNQFVFVDPSRGVVIVKLSSNRAYGTTPLESSNREIETIAFLRAIAQRCG